MVRPFGPATYTLALMLGAALSGAAPHSPANPSCQDEQVDKLREAGAPGSLVDALQAAIAAAPDRARLGVAVHVVEGLPPSPDAEPVEVVFSYGSSRFGRRREAAAEKAQLRAHTQILDAAWWRAMGAIAFPELLEGFVQRGRVHEVEDHQWEVGPFVCHLSIGPLSEVIVDEDALEEALVTYHERLESSARLAAAQKDWESVRLRLEEHLTRRPLTQRAMVLQLQLQAASGERERATVGAASLLQQWLEVPTPPLALLDLAELFMDFNDLERARSSIHRARQLLEREKGE
jgi:hypothetical protein